MLRKLHMISRPSGYAAAIAVALHLSVLGLALSGAFEHPVQKKEEPTLIVQLLQPAPPRSEPKPPEPPKPTPPKPVTPKPVPPTPAPQPAPVPSKPVPAPPPVASESAPAKPAPPAPPPPAAPAAASAPPAPPAPPPQPVARTEVSTASYHASNAKPVYPSMSKRLGEQGTVILRVLVKSDGTAGSVEVKSSSAYPRLDQAAMDAVKTWRFHPASVDGKPVDEWYQVPIPFKLQN